MGGAHLRAPLPRQEQVRAALVPVGRGSVPQELHLDPADQTGREAEHLPAEAEMTKRSSNIISAVWLHRKRCCLRAFIVKGRLLL